MVCSALGIAMPEPNTAQPTALQVSNDFFPERKTGFIPIQSLSESIALKPDRTRRLWQRVVELKSEIRNPKSEIESAIIPLIVGDESQAVATASALRERGFFVPAIRYPTVARGTARLRITLTADHTAEDVGKLTTALSQIVNRQS